MSAVAARSNAADLYAASGAGSSGELYILNPATGATITDVGPLNDSTSRNFGMTGLAFDPVSGVLYGSSANANADASTRGQLVRINPATGLVTPIGSFGLAAGGTMTDIAFDPVTHVLYGLPSNGGASLFTIDPATGLSTLVGDSGFTATNGGGIAVNSSSTIYSSPLPANFGTYDKTTAPTPTSRPQLCPTAAATALKFNGDVLYGLEVRNTTTGLPPHLVTIDTTTGAVTDVGTTTADFLDGIAFKPATALAGDYNHDGKVTAADYVVWKNGGSPTPNSPADYTTWKANFGKSAGSGAGSLSNAPVPEPSCLLLMVIGLLGATTTSRRSISR